MVAACHARARRAEDTDWAAIARAYEEQAEALVGYHLLHATRADLLRRLGRDGEAAAAYERAIGLAGNPVERAFLARRLAELAR